MSLAWVLWRRFGSRVWRCELASATGAAMIAVAHGVLGAQSASIPRGTSEHEVVASAEAEGAAYPRLASTSSVGSTPRKCVSAYDMGPIQSGEFTIGGDLGFPEAMRAGRQGKVWWAPLHRSATMPPLVVRGRNLTWLDDTVRYTTSQIAWPVAKVGQRVAEADRRYFFPSGITIPRGGRWLLIATSGANWGCFLLTVNAR